MIQFARNLLAMVRPYRLRLVGGVITGLLRGCIEPLLMLFVKIVVDVLFPTQGATHLVKLPSWAPDWIQDQLNGLSGGLSGAAQHPLTMLAVVGMLPGIMLIRGLLDYLNVYLLHWVASRAITDLRNRLFGHLFSLPLSFFHRTSTGELMSRVLNDVGTLKNAVSNNIAVIIKEPATLISLFVFLLYQNPRLTLASLTVLPLCVVPILIYSRKVRKAAARMQSQLADLSKLMHECFTGNRIIKAYNLEGTVTRQFVEKGRAYISQYMRMIRSMEIPGPLIEFFGAVGVALLLFYIALSGGDQKTSAGDFVMVVGSLFAMYRPIKLLTKLYSQLEQARSASERVFQLLDVRSDIVEPAQPVPLRAAQADIQFDHIDFNYGDKPVLRDIHLTVRAGTLVALVGSSGAGKTTITNLLLRFYDPQRGSVRIGGVDIRNVASRDLRNQISVVTQEVILFNDSIRNNIALGRPGASEQEIIAAARHAYAHEFILERPQGYDAIIGEKGVALSGGQRQRLAIARAILKDAPILVLDEATSSLDTESERAVQAALEELMKGRTTICIAHRLSTIQRADVIVVLDQGRIVEQGTHPELIKRGGIYQKLYEMQFQS